MKLMTSWIFSNLLLSSSMIFSDSCRRSSYTLGKDPTRVDRDQVWMGLDGKGLDGKGLDH